MKKLFGLFISLVACPILSFADPISLSVIYDSGFSKPFMIPAVTLGINGVATPLMVDLGANMWDADIIIKRKQARRLNLHGEGPKQCAYSQVGKTCYLPTTIKKLQVGNITLDNVKAFIALRDWSGASKYKGWTKGPSYKAGVITLNFLSKYNVLFDLPHDSISLYNLLPLSEDLQRWQRLPFILQDGIGVTTTEVFDGNTQTIIWDSALTPSIIDPTKVSASKIYDCPSNYNVFDSTPKCYTSTGALSTVFWAHDLGLPAQVPIKGAIGSNYFFEHKVFIDFRDQQIYIFKP